MQIKGHRLTSASKPGQRLGSIDLEKEWDAVLLVLLDERYNPTAIYETDRRAVRDALEAPGSRARNERGQLSISKFKSHWAADLAELRGMLRGRIVKRSNPCSGALAQIPSG